DQGSNTAPSASAISPSLASPIASPSTEAEDRLMLPHIAPMLATAAQPFDHPDYAFEIKWDGVRALAAVEPDGWRVWGRRGADYTARYPELCCLSWLPPGTIVD